MTEVVEAIYGIARREAETLTSAKPIARITGPFYFVPITIHATFPFTETWHGSNTNQTALISRWIIIDFDSSTWNNVKQRKQSAPSNRHRPRARSHVMLKSRHCVVSSTGRIYQVHC